jgi:hypothetical protein
VRARERSIYAPGGISELRFQISKAWNPPGLGLIPMFFGKCQGGSKVHNICNVIFWRPEKREISRKYEGVYESYDNSTNITSEIPDRIRSNLRHLFDRFGREFTKVAIVSSGEGKPAVAEGGVVRRGNTRLRMGSYLNGQNMRTRECSAQLILMRNGFFERD